MTRSTKLRVISRRIERWNSPGPDKSKLYYPTMPTMWWLSRRTYFLFMVRELSSVFIALFLVVFLVQIYQLANGQQSYTAFIQGLGSPAWITFHVVALLFAPLSHFYLVPNKLGGSSNKGRATSDPTFGCHGTPLWSLGGSVCCGFNSIHFTSELKVAGKKTCEPFWWALFSAGGVVAAFLIPIHIVIVGFAVPLGWISDNGVLYQQWWGQGLPLCAYQSASLSLGSSVLLYPE